MFQQGALFEDERKRFDPGIRATAAVSIASAGKVCPSRAETVRSASKAEYIDFTRLSKPLKTESKMIIAATGIATATTLSPEIRLTTERDLGEKR